MSFLVDDMKMVLQYGVANEYTRAQNDGVVAKIKFRAPGEQFGIVPEDLLILALAKLQEYENHVSIPERKTAIAKIKESILWLSLLEAPQTTELPREKEEKLADDKTKSN